MEEISHGNAAELIGAAAGRPVFSHVGRGREYYTFPLEVRRLSGAADTVNILLRADQMEALEVTGQPRLRVSGEVRSFNNRSGVGSRLVITVLARQVAFTGEPDANRVLLRGALCRAPTFRQTPMGREICDLMLAVNRRYGRSDYIPCIAWGKLARRAAGLSVGVAVALTGRLQSRKYLKTEAGVQLEKTAFEVSVTELTFPEIR